MKSWLYIKKSGSKRKTMLLSPFDQTDPLRALAINDLTIKQSPEIGPWCGYNCSSWVTSRHAWELEAHWEKTNKELTSFKIAISFVFFFHSASFALQHGGFVQHEWPTAESLLCELNTPVSTFLGMRKNVIIYYTVIIIINVIIYYTVLFRSCKVLSLIPVTDSS